MHVCCCWIQEGRVAKGKRRLQQNCTLTMHYLKKKEKKKDEVSPGQCPLPTDFFCVLSISGHQAHKSDKVTLPSLLLIIQSLSHLKSVQWFNRHLRQASQNTLHTLSAICRCCQTGLFGQGFFFLLWCPYLTSKRSHCPCDYTSCNWILLLYHSILIHAFFICVYQW